MNRFTIGEWSDFTIAVETEKGDVSVILLQNLEFFIGSGAKYVAA